MKNKILYVDDDIDLLKLVTKRLSAEGYKVTTASTGKSAMDIALSEMPDLIILDVILPDVDGFEVCRKMKDIPSFKNIPVIMLTGISEAEQAKKAVLAMASAYFVKPVDTNELSQKIRSLLK